MYSTAHTGSIFRYGLNLHYNCIGQATLPHYCIIGLPPLTFRGNHDIGVFKVPIKAKTGVLYL